MKNCSKYGLKTQSRKRILLALVVVFLLSASALSACAGQAGSAQPALQIKEYVDLGMKYLLEQNYEEAIISFEKAIALDPKNLPAYEGIADAYRGQNNYEKAVEYLERGLDEADGAYDTGGTIKKLTDSYRTLAERADAEGDDEAAFRYYSKISELDKEDKEAEEWIRGYSTRSDLKAGCADLGKDVEQMMQAEDYESLYQLMESDRLQEIIDLMEDLGDRDRVIFRTENGKAGIYRVVSKNYGPYMLYYGDYDGNLRSGNGVWIGSHAGAWYCAIGEWKNDQPNGRQVTREWRPGFNTVVETRELIGNTVNGLWEGSVDFGFITDSGKGGWIVNFSHGKWVVIGDTPYESTGEWVVSRTSYDPGGNRGDDVMLTEDKNLAKDHGIAGFTGR